MSHKKIAADFSICMQHLPLFACNCFIYYTDCWHLLKLKDDALYLIYAGFEKC